jgi:hypothetical protein
MADWSIKIVPASSGSGAAFQPDLKGYNPGDSLPAEQDDLVTWSNRTGQTHQPWMTDSSYNPLSDAEVLPRGSTNYMSDQIPPNESSRPSYDVAQPTPAPPATPPNNWTVYYFCKLHPTVVTERGTIEASIPPTS